MIGAVGAVLGAVVLAAVVVGLWRLRRARADVRHQWSATRQRDWGQDELEELRAAGLAA